MYSNQQPSTYSTRHSTYNSQLNSNNNDMDNAPINQKQPSQSTNYYSNNQPSTSTIDFDETPNFKRQSTMNSASSNARQYSSTSSNNFRSKSSGSTGRGIIEKTNMMSSENPFHDPARSYEQMNSARRITSITSAPKSTAGINKTLNLSDENPFFAFYGNYHYPSQIDPTKRITNQATANRSTENKSLNLSDENPFYSTYERYHYPTQNNSQKRTTEIPKMSGPLISTNDLSNNNSLNTYRPSLIREYSAGGSGSNSFTSSIADWARNHPAPLSYRPIHVQRPPPEFYSQSESSNLSSYIPPASPPRQQQLSSPTRIQSQSYKPNPSVPLDKTSLNMSPDNPFADTYGRYYYPSTEEIKTQKRLTERNIRFTEQHPISDTNNRLIQSTNQMSEYPETEKKDIVTGKGNTKFTRFDVNF